MERGMNRPPARTPDAGAPGMRTPEEEDATLIEHFTTVMEQHLGYKPGEAYELEGMDGQWVYKGVERTKEERPDTVVRFTSTLTGEDVTLIPGDVAARKPRSADGKKAAEPTPMVQHITDLLRARGIVVGSAYSIDGLAGGWDITSIEQPDPKRADVIVRLKSVDSDEEITMIPGELASRRTEEYIADEM